MALGRTPSPPSARPEGGAAALYPWSSETAVHRSTTPESRMTLARKPLSKRTRFDVFKRDGFKCAYCGTTPPKVVLEVDHVVPLAAGGTDDIDNLVTACWDCNHGKGARQLGVAPRPGVTPGAVEEMQERAEQLAAYREMVAALEDEKAKTVDMVMEAWCFAFGGERTETGWSLGYTRVPKPHRVTILRYIESIGLEAVLHAVKVSAGANHVENRMRDRYFYGVCKGKEADKQP